MKNCYIHIPFCSKICSYCDFCKMFYNKKFVSSYLEALDREIYDVYRGEELETIEDISFTIDIIRISKKQPYKKFTTDTQQKYRGSLRDY